MNLRFLLELRIQESNLLSPAYEAGMIFRFTHPPFLFNKEQGRDQNESGIGKRTMTMTWFRAKTSPPPLRARTFFDS